ncbi:MAG: hypothetical protein U0904_05040 [Candidatus Nanopelagicales bacterium]|nr:hypothetical protein [Candidatus Nanopelagicales bacterium]
MGGTLVGIKPQCPMLAQYQRLWWSSRLASEHGPGRGLRRPGSPLGWDIEELARELGEIFDRPVDLVARRGLHPRLASIVLSEAKMLYAA